MTKESNFTVRATKWRAFFLLFILWLLPACSILFADRPKPISYSMASNSSQLELEWTYFSETFIRLGPLVADGLIMIMDSAGVVTTFDHASGEIVWQYESGHAVGLVSPATPKWVFYEDRLIFTVGLERLIALNYLTGELIWETQLPKKLIGLPTMVIVDEAVAIAEWDEAMFSYVGFYRLHDGQITWHTQMPSRSYRFLFACPYIPVPVPIAETICVVLHDRTLILDGRSGASSTGSTYFKQLPHLSSYNTPVYQDGLIFTNPPATDTPYVEVFDTESGERLHLEPVCDQQRWVYNPVTIFEDRVFVANGCNHLHVTDLSSLQEPPPWVYRSPHPVRSRFVTLDGQHGYILNARAEIIEINLETGQQAGKIILDPQRTDPDQPWNELTPDSPYLYALVNGYTVLAFKRSE